MQYNSKRRENEMSIDKSIQDKPHIDFSELVALSKLDDEDQRKSKVISIYIDDDGNICSKFKEESNGERIACKYDLYCSGEIDEIIIPNNKEKS